MEEVLTLKKRIKRYGIQSEDGQTMVEIALDASNDAMFSRFMDLYEHTNDIAIEAQARLGNSETDAMTIDAGREVMNVNTDMKKRLLEETEKLLGEGFCHAVWADHYAIDKNFEPSLDMFIELYELIMPLFAQTYKDSANKYSTKKGGRKKA